jgi:ABC-type transporter Mla maintaining outer membrane lipid asymmetry ATPase subunit MlaF
MQRRVSMALELIKSPAVLFLDEPTSVRFPRTTELLASASLRYCLLVRRRCSTNTRRASSHVIVFVFLIACVVFLQGLDTYTAFSIVNLLREVAHEQGKTVVSGGHRITQLNDD